MRFDPVIFWSLVALVVLVVAAVMIYRDSEIKGAVYPPKHISVTEMDKFHPQDVYDWVVYAIRMTDAQYLVQLAWPRSSKHDFLLSDLCTVLHARTEEDRLKRLKEIGRSFNLDTSIVDEAF